MHHGVQGVTMHRNPLNHVSMAFADIKNVVQGVRNHHSPHNHAGVSCGNMHHLYKV